MTFTTQQPCLTEMQRSTERLTTSASLDETTLCSARSRDRNSTRTAVGSSDGRTQSPFTCKANTGAHRPKKHVFANSSQLPETTGKGTLMQTILDIWITTFARRLVRKHFLHNAGRIPGTQFGQASCPFQHQQLHDVKLYPWAHVNRFSGAACMSWSSSRASPRGWHGIGASSLKRPEPVLRR